MNRLPRTLSAVAATAVLALGGAASAQAKHGADDPAGHEAGEHAGVHHHRHGGRDDAKASSRRGNDDAPGHKRHGGDDDGPNHR